MCEVRIAEKKLQVQVDQEKANLEKERLEFLKGLEVDISKVLVAECRLPDKTIRVENETSQPLHLHEHEV